MNGDRTALEVTCGEISERVQSASTAPRVASWQDVQATLEGVHQLAEMNLNIAALTAAIVALTEAVKPQEPLQ